MIVYKLKGLADRPSVVSVHSRQLMCFLAACTRTIYSSTDMILLHSKQTCALYSSFTGYAPLWLFGWSQ